ncbi:MAG: ABC transporter ATP-binding protein [Candidatus Thorarchaeota archaeon]|nr:ABC transporter ATP-binding protein [Candidatus Thorarchaeota archaeon]
MEDDSILGPDEAVYDFEDDDADVEISEDVKYAIRLVDVTRTYNLGTRKIAALENLNLEVRPGDFVVVSGYSGSGKTTLLNLIGAIDYATAGRVFVMDVPIGDYDEPFRATFRLNTTGFIFQSYNLVSTLTALENVMFPMQLIEKPHSELQKEAIRLLDSVELSDRLDHLPWQLSSGEQQRVAVARAMANDPPIILADEPTANLDIESGRMIRDLLHSLHKSGKTLVVMTHDENIMNLPGIRNLIMERGVLREDD